MTITRHSFILLVSSLVTLFAFSCKSKANISEDASDFRYAQQRLHEMNVEINKLFHNEAMMARRQKRANKYAGTAGVKYREEKYMEFYDTLDPDNKGHRPFLLSIEGTLVRWRIHHKDLGYDLDEQEQKLRDHWKKQHRPNRISDFKMLYDRFTRDKRWKDCVRIAKECYEGYDWYWKRREWLDRIITSMWNDNAFHEEMYGYIDRFADDYAKEVNAWLYLRRYIDYLRRLEKWDRAARLSNLCVKFYENCDWEPAVLQQAITIHTKRWNAQKDKGDAGTTAAEASNEKNDDEDSGRRRKRKNSKKSKTSVAESDPGHSGKLTFLYALRMMRTYPYATETSSGMNEFYRWVLGENKENPALGKKAAELGAKYLTTFTDAPAWGHVYGSVRSLLDKDSPDREAIQTILKERGEKEATRNEVMKERINADQSFAGQYLVELKDFIVANPDCPQARKAVDVMTKYIAKPEMIMLVEKNLPTIVEAIKQGFSHSPAFRSVRLQNLANCFGQPFVNFIYEELIDATENDLQKEYLYYRNAWRPTQKQSYDLKTFKAWLRKYEKSYYIPEVGRSVVRWAMYAENPQDAVVACDEMAEEDDYARSMIVIGVLHGAITHYTRAAVNRIVSMNPEKYTENGKKNKKYQKLWKKYGDKAETYANLIDDERKKDINLGSTYHSAMHWGNHIRFRKHSKRTGKEILARNPFTETYLYYYTGAWTLDVK